MKLEITVLEGSLWITGFSHVLAWSSLWVCPTLTFLYNNSCPLRFGLTYLQTHLCSERVGYAMNVCDMIWRGSI